MRQHTPQNHPPLRTLVFSITTLLLTAILGSCASTDPPPPDDSGPPWPSCADATNSGWGRCAPDADKHCGEDYPQYQLPDVDSQWGRICVKVPQQDLGCPTAAISQEVTPDGIHCTLADDSCPEGFDVKEDEATQDGHVVCTKCILYEWYLDGDGDGSGKQDGSPFRACKGMQPEGYVLNHMDCDDSRRDVHPSAFERCDGADNDCDGQHDNADATHLLSTCTPPLNTTATACTPEGACVFTCADGTVDLDKDLLTAGSNGTGCECTESAEVCGDGIDNDCDGEVDNGIGCLLEDESPADVINRHNIGAPCEPSPEVCDGVDNDCDGIADEGFPGVGSMCEVGVGRCKATGVIVCSGDRTRVKCSAEEGTPLVHDICGNGVDDDCNGTPDDNCRNCHPDLPPNRCGLCGGPQLGEPEACPLGVGICEQTGFEQCAEDGRSLVCVGEVIDPQPEICDGEDNNCDGRTDEGTSPTLLANCARDLPPNTQPDGCGEGGRCIFSCGNGFVDLNNDRQLGQRGDGCECQITEEEETSCDGRDNDCDGEVDEGLHNACGQCGQLPEEVCDGEDNDCDGDIDEGFGLGQDCRVGMGRCVADGTIICNGLRSTQCSVQPGTPLDREVCGNNVDDDCDGQTDEDANPGDCTPCEEGQPNACGGCTNLNGNVGDNCGDCGRKVCDGEDALRCEDSGSNECGGCVPLVGNRGDSCGDCDDGTLVCDGQNAFRCNGASVRNVCGDCGPLPEEVCDGEDNDCDGQIDEGLLNACGECGPVPEEVCDGQDNDCDGQTDENLLNACGRCGPVPEEICDNIDNDCDNVIDDGVENACGGCADLGNVNLNDPCGPCSDGRIACNGEDATHCVDASALNACEQCGPVPEEVCDGQDNDCDGQTDEGVQNACGGCGPVPEEVCDGQDNDCDGQTDEGLLNICGTCGPVPEEICNDGEDNDCDGLTDLDDPECTLTCEHGGECPEDPNGWDVACNSKGYCQYTNPDDQFMSCVYIPAGRSFFIGSDENEQGRRPEEGPQRFIQFVHGYCISTYEMTVGQYEECGELCGDPDGTSLPTESTQAQTGLNKLQLTAACSELVEGARLPSESEWEYAAKGATQNRFTWGAIPLPTCEYVNMDPGGSPGCGDGQIATVDSRAASISHVGLYNMLGNALEIVEDCGDVTRDIFPTDGSPKTRCNPVTGYPLVIKGGSWRSTIDEVYLALRNTYLALLSQALFRDDRTGGRCVYWDTPVDAN